MAGAAVPLLQMVNDPSFPSDLQLELSGIDPEVRYLLTALLSYHSGLPPRSVLGILAPYQACLPLTLPGDVSGLPDRVPTEEEAAVLDAITGADLSTSPALLTDAADSLDLALAAVQEVARLWRIPTHDDDRAAGRTSGRPLAAPAGEATTREYSREELAGLADTRPARALQGPQRDATVPGRDAASRSRGGSRAGQPGDHRPDDRASDPPGRDLQRVRPRL